MASSATTILSGAEVESVRIADIKVGVRRRKSVGGVASLAKSIETHGLFHPILLRDGNELVAGGRRLAAYQKLGRTHIPARRIEDMTDEELREIEMEENAERLDLNDFEASKSRTAELKQAEATLKAGERKAPPAPLKLSGADEIKGRGGSRVGAGRPPSGAVSRKALAEVTGISPTNQQRIADHVALAEEFPFMQQPGWVMGNVITAGEAIEKLPEQERPKVAALLDQPGVPPKKAIAILENLVELPPAERKAIFKLAESDDEHDQGTALSRAAALPDPVDPGLTLLRSAVEELKKAARYCREQRFKARISDVCASAEDVLASFQSWNRKVRS